MGVSATPVIGICRSINTKSCENLLLYKNLVNEEFEVEENDYPDSSWAQIVGDFPHGDLDNGFGNKSNVNIRGATTFIVDAKEYLLFGTGNVNKSFSISSSAPPSQEAAIISVGLSRLQLILRMVVTIIDRQFKQLSGTGCELWCYHVHSGWQQSVGNRSDALIEGGFNNSNNTELTLLIPYRPSESAVTYLYAGTWNQREGCELWRTTDPINGEWEPLIHKKGTGTNSSGFGNPNNTAAYSAAVFDGWLYIGTMNWWNGCEIWRTNGNVWQRVIGGKASLSGLSYGFGDDDKGFERDIYAWEMQVYNDSQGEQLYVGTFNIAGCELWRTRNATTWECLIGENGVLKRGFNEQETQLSTHNYGIRRMVVFNNSLYLGSASTPSFTLQYNKKHPAIPLIDRTKSLEGNLGQGFSVWRYNGAGLTRIVGGHGTKNCCNGFGDKTNAYVWSLHKYDDRLFAGTMNPGTCCINVTMVRIPFSKLNVTIKLENQKSKITDSGGCEIWYTKDGEDWHQIVGDEVNQRYADWPGNGFDDENNTGARAMVNYQDSLYIGVTNDVDGCEIWRFDGSNYPDNSDNEVKQMNITFKSGNYELYGEIYYPANETRKYPGIVFCEGLPAYVSAYSWIPNALAKQGYVVIIYDPPGLGRSEGIFPRIGFSFPRLNFYFRFGSYFETPIHYFKREWVSAVSDALTYLLDESPVKHLIDNTSIGLIGHSLGGITTTEAAAEDKQFDAIVALSHGNPLAVKKIDVPIQFQCGDFDRGLYSIPITRRCYMRANIPKELIVIQRGTHFGFTTAFRSLCPCPSWQKEVILRYAIGWFDYFLKNKEDALETITTGTDHLSKFIRSRYNFGDGDHILE
jgi:dienelactone hydrolase